jgi:hypothetical protein
VCLTATGHLIGRGCSPTAACRRCLAKATCFHLPVACPRHNAAAPALPALLRVKAANTRLERRGAALLRSTHARCSALFCRNRQSPPDSNTKDPSFAHHLPSASLTDPNHGRATAAPAACAVNPSVSPPIHLRSSERAPAPWHLHLRLGTCACALAPARAPWHLRARLGTCACVDECSRSCSLRTALASLHQPLRSSSH